MAYGSGNSNIKMTPLSLTDANAWRDVLGWEINDGGASVDVGMAYSAVGWVNRCVHLRAGALKELPWSLMKGDSEIANSESEDTRLFRGLSRCLICYTWQSQRCALQALPTLAKFAIVESALRICDGLRLRQWSRYGVLLMA